MAMRLRKQHGTFIFQPFYSQKLHAMPSFFAKRTVVINQLAKKIGWQHKRIKP